MKWILCIVAGFALIGLAIQMMSQASRDALFNGMQIVCPAFTVFLISALAYTVIRYRDSNSG